MPSIRLRITMWQQYDLQDDLKTQKDRKLQIVSSHAETTEQKNLSLDKDHLFSHVR